MGKRKPPRGSRGRTTPRIDIAALDELEDQVTRVTFPVPVKSVGIRFSQKGQPVPLLPPTHNNPVLVNEPEGKFIWRIPGERFRGQSFHLYRDCPRPTKRGSDNGVMGVVDIQTIDILQLSVCSQCETRRTRVDPHEVLVRVLTRMAHSGRSPEGAAQFIESEISKYGLAIYKKRGSNAE